MKLSLIELRTLLYLKAVGDIPTGRNMIKWTSAARRLERKGLAGHSSLWYITNAGERYISTILDVKYFELTAEEKEVLSNSWWNTKKTTKL